MDAHTLMEVERLKSKVDKMEVDHSIRVGNLECQVRQLMGEVSRLRHEAGRTHGAPTMMCAPWPQHEP